MLHTLADIAHLCAVSKPAITQAVKRGNLIKNPDGKIDDTNEVNKLYIEGKTGAVKKQVPKGVPSGSSKPKRKKSPEDAAADQELTKAVLDAQAKRQRRKERKVEDSMEGEVDDDPDADDDGESEEDIQKLLDELKKEGGQAVLLLKKLKADIRYKERASERYELEIETKKKNLVEKAQLLTVVQGINKAIDDHLHRLPAKLGPVLFAMAKRDGSTELEVIRRIELDQGEALRRAMEDVCRLG